MTPLLTSMSEAALAAALARVSEGVARELSELAERRSKLEGNSLLNLDTDAGDPLWAAVREVHASVKHPGRRVEHAQAALGFFVEALREARGSPTSDDARATVAALLLANG